jgi:hypothetical protein
MSYDDWKCSPPDEDLGYEPHMAEPEDDEPEYTCDCGSPLDPTLKVSLCRGCFESCSTWPPPAEVEANSDETAQARNHGKDSTTT